MTDQEVWREQAYLVARGVRAMALCGQCPATPMEMLNAISKVEAVAVPGAIPFIVQRKERADFGFAAHQWVIELFQWVTINDVPDEHRHRIVGLLLGYSPSAIRDYDESTSGRGFADLCTMIEE